MISSEWMANIHIGLHPDENGVKVTCTLCNRAWLVDCDLEELVMDILYPHWEDDCND